MKTTLLFVTLILSAQLAFAETVVCTGRTNNPNTTDLNFEIEITGKRDKFTRQNFYKSYIRYTLPDGSHLNQGIDLNGRPRTKVDKVIYSGSNIGNYLELTFGADGLLQKSVLNNPLLGMKQLSVQCEVGGTLPERPVCSNDSSQELLLASRNGTDTDAVETAISCGANVNQADKNGCTPLMYTLNPTCGQTDSVQYQSPMAKTAEIVDLLINNGAFVAVADKKGETPLIKAAKYGIRGVYSSFIAAEADFDTQDNLGNTTLMFAVFNRDAWLIEEVLEGNPNRTLKNKAGETAFDIAKRLQSEEAMELVRPADAQVVIQGGHDGTCSPLEISLKQGQVVEFVLKASHKMFKLDAKALGLDLMAEANSTHKQIVTLENKGTYSFTCGYHGANEMSQGKIVVQ